MLMYIAYMYFAMHGVCCNEEEVVYISVAMIPWN
jgi:hypothetical protein